MESKGSRRRPTRCGGKVFIATAAAFVALVNLIVPSLLLFVNSGSEEAVEGESPSLHQGPGQRLELSVPTPIFVVGFANTPSPQAMKRVRWPGKRERRLFAAAVQTSLSNSTS